jgi:hypothetical protein
MCFYCSLPLVLTASLLIVDHPEHFSSAQAQPVFTSPAHVPDAAEAAIGALISLALAVLLIALIAAGVLFHQERRRRYEEASELTAQIAAAFLQDPRLTGLLLVPSASVPMVPGKPVKIAIVGTIPSIALRPIVLQIAREELRYSEGETMVEDRLTVSPAVPPVAA